MSTIVPGVRRRVATTLLLLGVAACADETTAPGITPIAKPNAALGDVITVTNTSGGKDVGSLRWAVAQATGGEVIRFAPALAGATIVLDSTILVQYPITVEGPADKGITISGNNAHQVFTIALGLPSPTTLRNLAIVNGKGAGSAGGAGVLASSDVVLEHVTLSNHTGDNYTAFFTTGNATFINSTVSSSTTVNSSAAVFVQKNLTLVNSTIAFNDKGGVDVRGTLTLRNSLLAHNGTAPNCQNVPAFVRFGQNLADDTSCGDSTVMLVAGAQLDSLRDNGGPAKTHALKGPSPAINAGTDCTVTVDQRYAPRDGACDIGAYEFRDYTTVTLANNANATADKKGEWMVVSGTVRCSQNETLDLAVEVTQVQKGGKNPATVKGVGKVTVACSTTPQPWALALVPSNGVFTNANVEVMTKTDAGGWVTPAAASTTVKVKWGK